MPFQNNVLAGASGATGYDVPYSLRFRAANSANLTRSPASSGNRTTFTWSGWVKRGNLGSGIIFGAGNLSNLEYDVLQFNSDSIDLILGTTGALRVRKISTAVFRDSSAWYHIVFVWDSNNAVQEDRAQIYINNSRITSWSTNSPLPTSGMTTNYWNVSGVTQRLSSSASYFDGYMAEVNFIDGQALTPSSFGQTDSATGVWVPKKYSGTYGTNGFYLKFADATTTTTIGNDSSGNANNFTTSGISVTSGTTFDQMLDTPTLNYCVLNPLSKSVSGGSVKNANMTWNSGGGGATFYLVQSTFALSGKCYWECVVPATLTYHRPGIMRADQSPPSSGASYWLGGASGPANSVGYVSNDGDVYVGGAAVIAGATPSAGDILQFAFDAATGELWVGRNGTWLNSGDPAAGTGEVTTVSLSYSWVAAMCDAATQDNEVNFGQRAFSYTPPTGFKALNTANLPTPSIKKGSLYMDATLRTGTGATASVSSLGFQPDLVWIKSRSAATNHNLFDSTRGVQKGLGSNLQSAQYTDANSFTAFNSNGYSLGSDASSRGVNINTNTYVDWAWKEGVTPGFDVVTFAGTGSAQAVNHGLGVAPEFMILRVYDDTLARTWACWHKNLTSAAYYLGLETTNGQIVDNSMFNSTAPTSTQFTAGSYNSISTKNTIAYLWAGVEGFSKFGSYTGNGSTDGPFVFCGFRPRWVMVKNGSGAESWLIYNTAVNPNNAVSNLLIANLSNAEFTSGYDIDILSNGFKLRASGAPNGSGSTYIFAAFAENPFKYSRAR